MEWALFPLDDEVGRLCYDTPLCKVMKKAMMASKLQSKSGLKSKQPKQVANAFYIYKRLFKYVRRYWSALLIAGLASMCYSGVDAWFIYFLKPLLNKGLVEKDHEFLEYAPFLVLGVFMLRGIASFFSNYNIASASRG